MAYISTNADTRRAAQEGIELRDEYGRGGTEVGRRTAGRIVRDEVDLDLAIKMRAYFARHEVDRQAPGFNRSDDEWPSNGFIAWQLWGGDPGRTWAERVVAEAEEDGTKSDTGGSMTQHKTYSANIEVKAATDAAPHGEFTALVSVFGNVDLVGDRVVKGAFADSLAEYKEAGKSIPVVWSHDWNTPESYIGKALEAEETDDGLLVKGAFFDTERAQTVRNLLTERVVTEFSFAYDVIDEAKADDGANELLKLKLLEVGPTLKGANPATQLVAAKSSKAEPGELSEGSWVERADDYGRVEYIMTEGFFGVDDDPLSLEATEDDPLALVRLYNEEDGTYVPTELFKGFRFSELTATTEKAAPPRTSQKAGRVLSSKNEGAIREAKQLLDGVLSSLAEPGKSIHPETPEDILDVVGTPEGEALDPAVALLLIELAEH